jgi:hypothetical protein
MTVPARARAFVASLARLGRWIAAAAGITVDGLLILAATSHRETFIGGCSR